MRRPLFRQNDRALASGVGALAALVLDILQQAPAPSSGDQLMRVCLVGGTGNISTSILRLLIEVGHEVTVFNRGQPPGLPPGVRAVQGDRKDRQAFETAIQAQGLDANSLIADPLFIDPANDDYTLNPESPAFDLGFKPIDTSQIGPRPR